MNLETDMIYLIDPDNEDARHVFFDEDEVSEYLLENMDDPEGKFKKAVKEGEIEGPSVVEVEIPSELTGDEKWHFIEVPFTSYLTSRVSLEE